MIVNAIQCPTCLDVIFSRAQHDFHRCSCGEVAIDGGFDYVRCAFKDKRPIHVELNLAPFFTKQRLYHDWNKYKDKYGIISTKMRLISNGHYLVRRGKFQNIL